MALDRHDQPGPHAPRPALADPPCSGSLPRLSYGRLTPALGRWPQAGQLAHDSIILILSTPCIIGTLVALILNAIMPAEPPDPFEGKALPDPTLRDVVADPDAAGVSAASLESDPGAPAALAAGAPSLPDHKPAVSLPMLPGPAGPSLLQGNA